MTSDSHIVVAMSGGVDSSVAAAILVNSGYQVTGIMLKLWNAPGTEAENRCCSPDAMAMARRVAAKLDIPFYTLDAKEVFHDQVVQYFIDSYAAGITPNPCMVCNKTVRWDFLLNKIESFGAQYLATGHYARIVADGSDVLLLKGRDLQKDQSYILSHLSQEKLRKTIFPLGNLIKPEVRSLAQNFNLPVADRDESQDLCFLGNQDYRDFLSQFIPEKIQPGAIKNVDGEIVGEHQGLAFYTVGQRKGLNLGTVKPTYVVGKDIQENILVVGLEDQLYSSEMLVKDINWIRDLSQMERFQAEIKIRYRSQTEPGWVIPGQDNSVRVLFNNPMKGITPGQVAAFYQDEICLAGGVIQ